MPVFTQTSQVPVPVEELFAWHARPGAFERLTPPWETICVREDTGGIADGARKVFEIRQGPLSLTWEALHRNCVEGRQFEDVQMRGPFTEWVHTHRFEPESPERSRLEDVIHYRLPLGMAGQLAGGALTERKLQRMFAWRHFRTRADLERHHAFSGCGPQRIAVTGASGLVGRAFCAFMETGGHRIDRLVRRTPRPEFREVFWDPEGGRVDTAGLEGVDAVVHLAGENVAARRWTAEHRARIRDSRVQGSRGLCEALARMRNPPRALISASAIGYYGDRGDEVLTETSAPGTGFLADVSRDWESATQPASEAGIRVVHLRVGMVLSAREGALARLLPLFRLGLGGTVGSGRQYWSWIALDDLVGAIQFLLFTDGITGPVNGTAPEPLTNLEFTRTLARVLRRPAPFPVPAFAVRLVLGELADHAVLMGNRVRPARLQEAGFRFLHPDLASALHAELGF